jgi:hypothetical protein
MRMLITWLRRLFLGNGRPALAAAIEEVHNARPFEDWISGYHQRLRHSRERNQDS